MRLGKGRGITLCAVLMGLLATAVEAQSWTGVADLEIRVSSRRGGAVDGARVQLMYRGGREATGPPAVATDSKGRAVVLGLAAGTWQVEVSHPDFMSYVAVVQLDSRAKPEVTASFLEAASGASVPIQVKLSKARGGPASPPLPAAPVETEPERTAETSLPPAETPSEPAPTRPASSPTAEAALPESAAPQPVTPDAATEALMPAADPAPSADAEASVEEVAAPEPSSERPVTETATRPTVAEPAVEPPAAPAAPAPTEPVEPTAPDVEPEPAIEREPQPEPPTDTELPAGTELPAEPVLPTEPDALAETDAVAEPDSAAPPLPTPAREPEAMPQPAPAEVAPEIEPSPGQPAAAPAAPTAAPAALSAPEWRAYSDRTCPECRPGEWAVTVDGPLSPSGACPAVLVEAIHDGFGALSHEGALELAGFAGRAQGDAGALDAAGDAAPSELSAAIGNAANRGCRTMAVVLPKGARFVGFQYEFEGASGREPCLPDRPCAGGSVAFMGPPRISRGAAATVVHALALRQTDGGGSALLTVYFRAPHSQWRPR